jgi:hypothetical protein
MWRSLCAAAIVYGCGHPGLDGYRPAALDAPLHAVYRQVNKAGQEGQKVLASASSAGTGYFKAYMGRAGQQLRAAEHEGSNR